MSIPKKKRATKKQSLSAADTPLSKAEQVNVDHLLSQALLRYKNELLADKKIKTKEISHLSLIAEEYLSSFILLGYSLQDEQVVVCNMPSPKDEAALVDLLRATFLDISGGRQ